MPVGDLDWFDLIWAFIGVYNFSVIKIYEI